MMNKRVLELAEQAGYKPLPGFDFANSLEEVYIKNFAELIVRECASIVNDNNFEGSKLGNHLLFEHFGIKD